ncbi:MAG TPA: energy transducer TonB [Longimicrobium sp.]|jgi:TonB family protein
MSLLASVRRPLLVAVLICIPSAAAAQGRTPLPQNGAYTEPPQLLNQAEVTALALSSYPQQLKDLGLGGSPHVRLFIDSTGAIAERRIERSSALPALDSAALKVVDAMRFAPAKNGEQPTHLWVTLPVQFRIAAATGQLEPFKTPPRVTNLREIMEQMSNRMAYRTTRSDRWPRLRVFVAKDGTPTAIEMNDPSGDAAHDSAAMLAALAARFEPARNAAGQPVEAWMLITIQPVYR